MTDVIETKKEQDETNKIDNSKTSNSNVYQLNDDQLLELKIKDINTIKLPYTSVNKDKGYSRLRISRIQ